MRCPTRSELHEAIFRREANDSRWGVSLKDFYSSAKRFVKIECKLIKAHLNNMGECSCVPNSEDFELRTPVVGSKVPDDSFHCVRSRNTDA